MRSQRRRGVALCLPAFWVETCLLLTASIPGSRSTLLPATDRRFFLAWSCSSSASFRPARRFFLDTGLCSESSSSPELRGGGLRVRLRGGGLRLRGGGLRLRGGRLGLCIGGFSLSSFVGGGVGDKCLVRSKAEFVSVSTQCYNTIRYIRVPAAAARARAILSAWRFAAWAIALPRKPSAGSTEVAFENLEPFSLPKSSL